MNLDKLAEIAKLATPGPWTAVELNECQCDECGVACENGSKRPPHHDSAYVPNINVVPEDDYDSMSMENAAFIAAMNPTVALALIEVARAGDAVRHEMVDRNGAFLKLVATLDTLHALTGEK